MKIVFSKLKSEKVMLSIVLMCLIIVMISWGPLLRQRDDHSAVKDMQERQLSNDDITAMFRGQIDAYGRFVEDVQKALPANGYGTYSLMLDESVSYTGGHVGERPQYAKDVRESLSEQMLNLKFSVTDKDMVLLNLSMAKDSKEYDRGLIYAPNGVNKSLSGFSASSLSDSWYCYSWQAL